MIVTRTIQISSGVAPFSVVIGTCDCATATTPSFVAPALGLYQVSIDFPGDCFDDCAVTILVQDADGCRTTLDFMDALTNPCAAREVEIISDGYNFHADVTGPASTFTYSWVYPKSIFKQINTPGGPTLQLEFLPGNHPVVPQSVSVFITDAEGCTAVATKLINLCRPFAISNTEYVAVPCLQTGAFEVSASPCTRNGETIDWTTFRVEEVRDSDGDVVVGKVWVQQDCSDCPRGIIYDPNGDPLQSGNFTVYWTVADSTGVRSNTAEILVYFFPCVVGGGGGNEGGGGVPTNKCTCNLKATCEEAENEHGIALVADLTNCFTKCDCDDQSKEVDPNSFQIVGGPYIPGAYVIFDPGALKLYYYAPAGSVGVDVVEYIICTESQQCSQISTITFYLNCVDPPTLVDDMGCTICGLPITINVLANDSGPNIDPSSLTIVEQPQHGLIYIDVNYNIVYTPFVNFSGEDSFTYTVTNFGGQGGTPDPATVTITVSCAGEGEEITICDPAPFPVSGITSSIECSNSVNDITYQIVLSGYLDYGGSPLALDAGDIVHIQSAGIGLNVDLIVGQNPLLPAGYTNDVGGNWATLTSYLTAGIMTPSELLAGTYTINFNKKGWADANGYHNIYDTTTGAQTQNQAVAFTIDATVEDVSESTSSTTTTTTIKKVKVLAFEDTSYPLYAIKPKGVGTWSTSDGVVPTPGCDADCVADGIESWYSQYQGSCTVPYLTLPPSEVTAYKKIGVAAVPLSPGVPLSLLAAESQLILALNSFGPWAFKYIGCAVPALATYGVGGYNSSFVVSCFLVDDAVEDLEYFEITYDNGTANDGKTARMTLDIITLF